jgi:restriction system protein
MPRRRASAFDDLLTFASKLPWKVSVGLAAGSYLALHLVAIGSSQPAAVTNPADLGNVVIRQFIHVFGLFTQYIIPIGFLIGAAVSLIKRRRAASSKGHAPAATSTRSIGKNSSNWSEKGFGSGLLRR